MPSVCPMQIFENIVFRIQMSPINSQKQTREWEAILIEWNKYYHLMKCRVVLSFLTWQSFLLLSRFYPVCDYWAGHDYISDNISMYRCCLYSVWGALCRSIHWCRTTHLYIHRFSKWIFFHTDLVNKSAPPRFRIVW